MMLPSEHQAIIDKLYALYNSKGFIREEEALDLLTANDVSLQDTQRLIEILLGMGMIFADDKATDDGDDIENTQIAYENMFKEALLISPGQAILVDYIRNIRPPQRREWRVLMPQAKTGNLYAFSRLFDMYLYTVIKNALQFYTTYQIDFDDAVQECSIGLFKAIRDFRNDRQVSFLAFVQLCMTRQIITAIKTFSRKKHIPLNNYVSLDEFNNIKVDYALLNSALYECITNPEEIVIKNEEAQSLQHVLEEILSPLELKAILAYIAGKSYQETADDLHYSIKTIDNALQRAKNKLSTIITGNNI